MQSERTLALKADYAMVIPETAILPSGLIAHKGDHVLLEHADRLEDGKLYVVRIDRHRHAELVRAYQLDGGWVLCPTDFSEPYTILDLELNRVEILGAAVRAIIALDT